MRRFASKPRTTDEPSDAILARLQRLHPKIIDLSLGRILDLLECLGRPQDRLPPVIHVAGTNGKGSVIAFLRAIFETAGYRVHAYTSPHLVRFTERIRVAGDLIGEESLSALLDECERANRGAEITFFEVTTAAALLAFARTPADVLLLEVGLGGRFDATNVIDRPAATVITPVSMDHMYYLGDTIRQIAAEKAAIQKPGIPSIVAPQLDLAAVTILDQARSVGAAPFVYGLDWSVAASDRGMRYRSGPLTLDLPAPGLMGQHQLVNAGTAIACLEKLDGFEIADTAIAEGLPAARWPARLQRMTEGPLIEALRPGWELWLDGGHNAGAGTALAETVCRWDDKPLYLIAGMASQKTPQNFLRPLAPWVRGLRAVAIPEYDGSLPADALAAAAAEVDIDSSPSADIDAAIAEIQEQATQPGRVLICGSLYLAGTVLARIEGTVPLRTAG